MKIDGARWDEAAKNLSNIAAVGMEGREVEIRTQAEQGPGIRRDQASTHAGVHFSALGGNEVYGGAFPIKPA